MRQSRQRQLKLERPSRQHYVPAARVLAVSVCACACGMAPPLHSPPHLAAETLLPCAPQGLPTIRAFGAGPRFRSAFLQELSDNGAWWFCFLTTGGCGRGFAWICVCVCASACVFESVCVLAGELGWGRWLVCA